MKERLIMTEKMVQVLYDTNKFKILLKFLEAFTEGLFPPTLYGSTSSNIYIYGPPNRPHILSGNLMSLFSTRFVAPWLCVMFSHVAKRFVGRKIYELVPPDSRQWLR